MEISSSYLPLLLFIASLVTEGLSVRCYVCSYSPEDRNNRTEKCTEENFQHENVYSHDCEFGCKTFVQYDSNEVLEHWRRNCLSEGSTVTNDCKTDKTRFMTIVTCTCDRDLCNHGTTPRLRHHHLWLFPLLLIAWASWVQH